jgi:hypothetical protein
MATEQEAALQAVRRRRRRGRVATWLLFPALILAGYLPSVAGRWLLVPGVVLLVALQGLRFIAFLQVCPRCRQPLEEGHGLFMRLPPACPTCALPID